MHHLLTVCWQSLANGLKPFRTWEFQLSWKTILQFTFAHVCTLVACAHGFCVDAVDEKGAGDSRTPTRHAEINQELDFHISVIVFVIGDVFGAIHCVAWSSPFPSDTERLLWHVFSLILLLMPSVTFIFFLIFGCLDILRIYLQLKPAAIVVFLGRIVACVGASSYIMARLILVVEAFITLRALTPSALAEVEWISFIPHI